MADSNFMIPPEKGIASLLSKGTINLNVLLRDIVVLETKVAGTMYYEPHEFEPIIKKDLLLKMVREPDNKFDKFAVALHLEDGKIGYLPKTQNEVIARLMDAGKEFTTKVVSKKWNEQNNWLEIEIETSIKA